jgi:hypothetical protein
MGNLQIHPPSLWDHQPMLPPWRGVRDHTPRGALAKPQPWQGWTRATESEPPNRPCDWVGPKSVPSRVLCRA